jgi:ABC-2 type transport system ATP-binding protein
MIHVEQLTKYYDDFCAVDHIDLRIDKGEILGLLGPNGAGKTTTMRMLTGYFKPSSGSIRVKEFNIEENPLEIKKIMGYLPESAPLYHGMLVYDYLDYVAKIRGIEISQRNARIRELADLCDMGQIMHKTIGALSKGLKQRVGLAHALMSNPEILIFDEPTSGLDPNQIVEIREIIRRIGREKTIILSTHILSEAEATCDRIVIIDQGKIVADGTAESLKESGGKESRLHVSLVNARSDEAISKFKALHGVLKVSSSIDTDNNGTLHLQLTCKAEDDQRAAVYQLIKETDWILLEFRQETKSLETIFRELTKEN